MTKSVRQQTMVDSRISMQQKVQPGARKKVEWNVYWKVVREVREGVYRGVQRELRKQLQ